VACVKDRGSAHRDFMGSPEGRKHLRDLDVDGRILLK
jgi:hypothetical protein